MFRTSAALACLILAATASATNHPQPQPTAHPVATSSSNSLSEAHSNANSTANGGAASAQGGQATASGGAGGAGGESHASAAGGDGGSAAATQSQNAQGGTATNAGNAQSVNLSSHYEEKLQAPNVYAPAVYASGSCATGWSAGVSIPGAGLSGGKSKSDPACDRREIVRVLTPLNPDLALRVACADPMVREVAEEGDCIYAPPLPPRADPASRVLVPDLSPYATKAELRDSVDKAFKQSQRK
jgi:hypothetical protein